MKEAMRKSHLKRIIRYTFDNVLQSKKTQTRRSTKSTQASVEYLQCVVRNLRDENLHDSTPNPLVKLASADYFIFG